MSAPAAPPGHERTLSGEGGGPRARWLVVAATIAALVPFLSLAALEWPSQPDLDSSDYAQYEAHAIALIEGRPYTDTGYLYTPLEWGFGPRAYPPGWPIALAGAFYVFGAGQAVAKALTLAFACGLLLTVGVYVGRRTHPSLGVASVAMLGVSPRLISASVSPLSDVPFAAIVWLTLLLVGRSGTWSPARALLVTALAGVAVLFRPHGLLLVAALGIWAFPARRERGPWVFVPPAVLVGCVVLGRILLPSTSLRRIPRFATMWQNLTEVGRPDAFALFESHLYPFPWDRLNDIYHLASALIMIVGFVALARARPRDFALWFLAVYSLALFALAPTSVDPRFALPLFPLFIFGLLEGVRLLASRFDARVERAAPLAFAGLLVGMTTAGAITRDRPPPLREHPAYQEVVEELSGRRDVGLRVASFRPRALALETGVPGVPTLRWFEEELHVDTWCDYGITHVLLGDLELRSTADAATREALESRPRAFELEYSNEEFELYRFDRGAVCPPAAAPSEVPAGQLRQ